VLNQRRCRLSDKKLGGGRNAPECVAGFIRNQWSPAPGTGVRVGWNMHTKVNRKLL